MLEKERVLDLLDKGIKRSERWIEDAEFREDESDQTFYQGQLKSLLDMKSVISKW